MQLKAYQLSALQGLRRYLGTLREAASKRDQLAATGLDIPYDFLADAWQRSEPARAAYTPQANALGEPLPAVCLKVPTGGGKTIIAVRAIDALRHHYAPQSRIVLWIVPSTQIYNQTLAALRDRNHPYRQELDLASGGRTLVLEKQTPFRPHDVEDYLAVLLLMLPAANRQSKESLRMFRDQGGFEAFFPPEDDYAAHEELLKALPNLDTYGANGFGRIVKSSLGNTLRLLRPIIIVDEGHKAYSPLAQSTLRGFNPVFMLELSATPTADANVLVEISGQVLLREEMIKLDLHLHSLATLDWRDVVRQSGEQRAALEQAARQYEANSGIYIRPICLIQVERTGKDQRSSGLIHAEDVREFLITRFNVAPEEIAIKSSQRDDIEGIDLLSRECPIRYIITKQALQEGWDCPFAYVLAVLTNPSARTGLTQLVGRILRQPYGRKTGVEALDESYAFCYRRDAGALLKEVLAGLSNEGMADLASRVVAPANTVPGAAQEQWATPRPQFAHWTGKVFLPCFVVPDAAGNYREIRYEVDILSRVDWNQINLERFNTLQLNLLKDQSSYQRVGLHAQQPRVEALSTAQHTIDPVFISKQLLEIVPNPWVAYSITNQVLDLLHAHSAPELIQDNLGFIIEDLRKHLIEEGNKLKKAVFLQLVEKEILKFRIVSGCIDSHNILPERIRVRGSERLNRRDGTPLQHSLFDPVLKEELNTLEQSVALYLDHNYWVLSWYRNLVKSGYSIQAWLPQRIYSDFIALGHDAPDAGPAPEKLDTVYVLETKGLHLKNEDTAYKQEVFNLANRLSQPTPWNAIEGAFSDHRVHFQMLLEDEWERVLNTLLSRPTR